jgi:hypothetical protein
VSLAFVLSFAVTNGASSNSGNSRYAVEAAAATKFAAQAAELAAAEAELKKAGRTPEIIMSGGWGMKLFSELQHQRALHRKPCSNACQVGTTLLTYELPCCCGWVWPLALHVYMPQWARVLVSSPQLWNLTLSASSDLQAHRKTCR